MIEDRVGELRLRVRTDIDAPGEVRIAAERVVRSALERCASMLEARAPGRVVFIRQLPLHVRCDETLFDDPDQIEQLAQAAADTIERMLIPAGLEADLPTGGAVVFRDEAEVRAAHLLAIARGQPAWFHALLDQAEPGGPLAALAAPARREVALTTLARLARAGVLAEVLAAQPPPAVGVLAAALGFDAPATQAADHVDVTLATDLAGPARALAAHARHWPPMSRGARALALHVQAAVQLDAAVDAAAADVCAQAAAHVLDTPAAGPATPAPVQAPAEVAPASPASTLSTTPLVEAPETSSTLVATRCAGLLYLLACVQELELAESLWQACLPEGILLARAMAALLGPELEDDPAAWLFGGVAAGLACPDVTPEQHAEVARATCAALVAALPRRGLAEIPSVWLTLAGHPAGRLLVATALGSPFTLFAWPATGPAALRDGLQTLLETWPPTATLYASPPLVTFDTSGRLQPPPGGAPTELTPRLPAASSAAAAALLSLVMGAPCQLFAARAGAPVLESIPAFVVRCLQRNGQLRLQPEQMDVVLDADAVDIAVRRAGLDRDPGWVPWLQRSVRFVFGS